MGLLQESTSLLYWITRSRVTPTDTSFALGWYSSPTVPSSTVSFNESSSQNPPMMEKRVNDSWMAGERGGCGGSDVYKPFPVPFSKTPAMVDSTSLPSRNEKSHQANTAAGLEVSLTFTRWTRENDRAFLLAFFCAVSAGRTRHAAL